MTTKSDNEEMKSWLNKYIRDILLVAVMGISSWVLLTIVQISSIISTLENKSIKTDENAKDIKILYSTQYTEKDAAKDNALIISKFDVFMLQQKILLDDVKDIKNKVK